jgi:hypothetical protein
MGNKHRAIAFQVLIGSLIVIGVYVALNALVQLRDRVIDRQQQRGAMSSPHYSIRIDSPKVER